MTDLTREDFASWPMELHVAIDAMEAVPRVVTPGEAEWVIADAAAWCWRPTLGINAASYEMWRGNAAPPTQPFSLATFNAAMARQAERNVQDRADVGAADLTGRRSR